MAMKLVKWEVTFVLSTGDRSTHTVASAGYQGALGLAEKLFMGTAKYDSAMVVQVEIVPLNMNYYHRSLNHG